MAGPVYKLWQARFKEAWHQLSEEEQRQRLAQVEEALTQVGGKLVLVCNSAWANEQWSMFGVEEFPDTEAVQKHSQLLDELNWIRYIESRTTLEPIRITQVGGGFGGGQSPPPSPYPLVRIGT